jgi:hypothetical protein
VLGFGIDEEENVYKIYLKHGALKYDPFLVMDEGPWEWVVLDEWELTQADKLVYTCRKSRYIEELDMHIVFIKTFLARRVN